MKKEFTDEQMQTLKDHLQALIGVEFFTIPVYLTAVYSFTDAALAYSPDQGKTHPLNELQQKALSVAVQEMYHLQGASNLANAVGVEPAIPPKARTLLAGQDLVVPHLEPGGHELKTRLGNLPAVIEAMIAVEKPDEASNFPSPNKQVEYPSIGDLYHATLELMNKYLEVYGEMPTCYDPHFMPGHNQGVYPTFKTRYKYNAVNSRKDLVDVINAIADQGEGREVMPEDSAHLRSGATPRDPCAIHKDFRPHAGTRFSKFDDVTHYCRFEAIQNTLQNNWKDKVGKDVFYEADGVVSEDLESNPAKYVDLAAVKRATSKIWSYLTDTMVAGLQAGQLSVPDGRISFDSAMLAFKYVLPLIWQHGECPSFVYKDGVTADAAADAMDVVDPLCLYHWDAKTFDLRSSHGFAKNACQGLNSCEGGGWGGLGTKGGGDGACATADFHTCQGGNKCNHQGGCAFLATNPEKPEDYLACSEQWIPGANTGAGTGGCQTPISSEQVFDKTYSQDPAKIPESLGACEKLTTLGGNGVWDEARKLFKDHNRGAKTSLQPATKVGNINYDGKARRAAVTPTSR